MEKKYSYEQKGNVTISKIQIEDVEKACLAAADHKAMLAAFSMNLGIIEQVAGEEGCVGVSYSVTHKETKKLGGKWTLIEQTKTGCVWTILEPSFFGPIKKSQAITIQEGTGEGSPALIVIENKLLDGPDIIMAQNNDTSFNNRTRRAVPPRNEGPFGRMFRQCFLLMGRTALGARPQPSLAIHDADRAIREADQATQIQIEDPMVKTMILITQEYFCNYAPLVEIPMAETVGAEKEI